MYKIMEELMSCLKVLAVVLTYTVHHTVVLFCYRPFNSSGYGLAVFRRVTIKVPFCLEVLNFIPNYICIYLRD